MRDTRAVDKIEKRLKRVASGNLGDYRSVGEGVCELKIDYGPGYRVYFGQIGSKIVLLLCGGDKSSQEQDIHRAKEYWKDYERRESTNKLSETGGAEISALIEFFDALGFRMAIALKD